MSDEEGLEIRLSDDDGDAPEEPQRTQDERERAREKEAQDARADAQVQKDAGAEAPAAGCADESGCAAAVEVLPLRDHSGHVWKPMKDPKTGVCVV